jgi:hypothetical protein
MKRTTGMPEKLLDSRRANCLTDDISTDAHDLSATHRDSAVFRQFGAGVAAVTFPTHACHLNLTARELKSSSGRLESLANYSELDFVFTPQQSKNKMTAGRSESTCHL